MNASIHGHEVLDLVLHAREPLTLEALEAQVTARYGADARFHTCSQSCLTFGQLVEFLHLRGKLVSARGAIAADPGKICEH